MTNPPNSYQADRGANSGVLRCEGQPLFLDYVIFAAPGEPPSLRLAVESTDLAAFLEYTQTGSVRKQILGDWAQWFEEGVHYFLVASSDELSEWVRRRELGYGRDLMSESIVGVPPPAPVSKKGRLFLLEKGLEKFLRKTSKPRAQTLQLALAAVNPAFRAPDLPDLGLTPRAPAVIVDTEADGTPIWEPLEDQDSSALELKPSQLPPAPDSRSDPQAVLERASDLSRNPEQAGLSLEERKFRHQTLQTLLQNVQQHREDPVLLHLAHMAAEEALGRRFSLKPSSSQAPDSSSPQLRGGLDRSTSPSSPSASSLGLSSSWEDVNSNPQTDLSSHPSELIHVLRDTGKRSKGIPQGPRTSLGDLRYPGRPAPMRLFQHGWHTMSAIGRAAGGFTAVTTGKAADLVAAQFGITPRELRATMTRYSRLVPLRRDAFGGRHQTEFSPQFANLIAQELQWNPDLKPVERAPLDEFNVGVEDLPKLSQPLDLEFDEPEPSRVSPQE